MAELTRPQMEALNVVFDEFALKDQRSYYEHTIARHKHAAQQINLIRATCAFITGLVAALSGLIVQSVFVADGMRCTPIAPATVQASSQFYCGAMSAFLVICAFLAVIMPALGGALGTLADLYQWDRLITVYEAAEKTIRIADAMSPLPGMNDETYLAHLQAFSQGALRVMQDESSQWGQLIHQPQSVQAFLQAEEDRVNSLKIQFPSSRGANPGSGTGANG